MRSAAAATSPTPRNKKSSPTTPAVSTSSELGGGLRAPVLLFGDPEKYQRDAVAEVAGGDAAGGDDHDRGERGGAERREHARDVLELIAERVAEQDEESRPHQHAQ